MSTQIYIVLPVADLPRSVTFFNALGYSQNPQFTDCTSASIVISEHIHVMLATHEKFLELSTKDVCDTSKCRESLHTLRCESREQVDDLVRKALAAGGTTHEEAQDYGFMYTHSFIDLDGHGWGLFHMNDTPPQE